MSLEYLKRALRKGVITPQVVVIPDYPLLFSLVLNLEKPTSEHLGSAKGTLSAVSGTFLECFGSYHALKRSILYLEFSAFNFRKFSSKYLEGTLEKRGVLSLGSPYQLPVLFLEHP